MENIGEYLSRLKEWVKEGWKFLFEDTEQNTGSSLNCFFVNYCINIFTFLHRISNF